MSIISNKLVTFVPVNKSQIITVITFPFHVNPYTYNQLSQDNGYNYGDLSDTAFAYAVKEAVDDRLHKDIRARDQFQVISVNGGVASNGHFNIVIIGAPSKSRVEGSIKTALSSLAPKSGTVRDLCKKMKGDGDNIKSAAGAFESSASKFADSINKCTIFMVGKPLYKDSNTNGVKVSAVSKLSKFVEAIHDKLDVSYQKLHSVPREQSPQFSSISFDAESFRYEMNISSMGAMAFLVMDYYSKQNVTVQLFGNKLYFTNKPSGQDKAAFARYADGTISKLKGNAAGIAYYASAEGCFTVSELKSITSSNLTKSEIIAALNRTISVI